MLRGTRTKLTTAAALAAGAALAQGGLRVSGNQSNYGSRSVRPGFSVQPVVMRLGPERTTEVAQRRLGPECAGLVTLEPDYIVRTTARIPRLRFHVSAEGETTLVINTPDGQWRCDESGGAGGRNPVVDVADGGAGQYDIWVGRRRAGPPLRALLVYAERGPEARR